VKSGQGDVIPESGGICYHVIGFVEGRSEPFDSSIMRRQSCFLNFKECSIIPGIYLGLISMKVGEIAKLIVKPDYAFGCNGCPPRIPRGMGCCETKTMTIQANSMIETCNLK